MNCIKSLLLLLPIVVTCGTTFAQHEFSKIADDVRIVSEELVAQLRQKGLAYNDLEWPRNISHRKVDLKKVPDVVLEKGIRWISTIIKAEWLPNDVNKRLIAIRKPKPRYFAVREPNQPHKAYIQQKGSVDYLIVRYKVAGHKIQVQENGIAMSILIDPNEPIRDKREIEAFLTDVIYKFLNYPVEKKGTLKFHLQSFTYNKKEMYIGTVDCDFNREDEQAWFKRIWWNHTYVYTDGKKVYLSLVERDGKPLKPQARPGIPSRF